MVPNAQERPVHPVIWSALNIPLGLTSGFTIITLSFLLAQAQISTSAIAALIGLTYLPTTWGLLWAPIVDVTLTRRVWFSIGTLAAGSGMAVVTLLLSREAPLPWITLMTVFYSVGGAVSSAAANGIIAHGAADNAKGRAGGWSQAGNVGAQGLGGGGALFVATHTGAAWSAGICAFLLCLASLAALPFTPMGKSVTGAFAPLTAIRQIGKDLSDLWRSTPGLLALILVGLPTATAAAENLWSAIAASWHASADQVAMADGLLGGALSLAGALAAGQACDRFDRKTVYLLCGLACALCDLTLIAAPRTPEVFVIAICLYSFMTGATYGTFAAVVLEVIDSKAAATRCALFITIYSLPVSGMTILEGWIHDRLGATGMLASEAAASICAALVFIVVRRAVERKSAA